MQPSRSKWAGRFTGTTFALGGIAWAVITLLLIGNLLAGMSPPNFILGPASSRIVAGGSAGSWFVMGLLSFLIIGIVGMGMSGLFYNHVESALGATLTGWKNVAAWIHLALGGGGAAVASLLMAWAGYRAGAYLLGPPVGGGCPGAEETPPNLGPCIGYVHTNILSPIVLPIAIVMAVALLGYLVGGLALGTGWLGSRKPAA